MEETGLDPSIAKSDLDSIRVVPNPYVMTNMMESAVANPFLNQRRKIMFTHVPADCIIKIFTVSGVLVDEIIVNNTPDNGIIHWDMLTRENLEIAAGMYIYHIDAQEIGEEKNWEICRNKMINIFTKYFLVMSIFLQLFLMAKLLIDMALQLLTF